MKWNAFTQNLRDTLGRFKPVFSAYNILHPEQLNAYKKALKRYGVDKHWAAPVSSQDFKDLEGELPWLDRMDSSEVARKSDQLSLIPEEWHGSIEEWSRNGYLILPRVFSEKEVDEINSEIDRLVEEGTVQWRYNGRKIMSAYQHSEKIREIIHKPELIRVLEFLLGKEVRLFQSINFWKGSEQKAHSDSVHMTTFPLGYLIACWIALENIEKGSGELIYYPGSHKLPYILNDDFLDGTSSLTLEKAAYEKYERRIEQVTDEAPHPPKHFLPKKGDVLIWHANLLHGGGQITDPQLTRKSMVLHFFAREVICYHEITQRPALLGE